MTAASALALASGFAWGLNMVIVRWALDTTKAKSDVGAFVSISIAAVVATSIALISGADTDGLTLTNMARFGLVGAIAPGAAQVLFMATIRTMGPARGGVLIGTAPMFGVILAIFFLGEDWKVSVIVGTVATVCGGVLVAWNPEVLAGPRSFGSLGAALAVMTAAAFGVRDVVARHFTGDTSIAVPWAASIVLVSGSLVLLLMTLVRTRHIVAEVRSTLPPMVWSGLVVGVALPALLGSLSRGEVGTVAPLNNGAQILAVVALSAVFLGRGERSVRIVVAVLLVAAGGTIIGATQ